MPTAPSCWWPATRGCVTRRRRRPLTARSARGTHLASVTCRSSSVDAPTRGGRAAAATPPARASTTTSAAGTCRMLRAWRYTPPPLPRHLSPRHSRPVPLSAHRVCCHACPRPRPSADKYQLNFISRISRERLELLAQSTLESQVGPACLAHLQVCAARTPLVPARITVRVPWVNLRTSRRSRTSTIHDATKHSWQRVLGCGDGRQR